MISLKNLLKEESFTAINKDSGEVSVFKTKDARDSAIKAGTHDKQDSKSAKGGDSPTDKKDVPKVNIFKRDSEPKGDEPKKKIPNKFPTKENSPMDPRYPYAMSKLVCENIIEHWSKVYGFEFLSLRLFNVYGTRSRTNSAYGAALGVFLKQKILKKPFTIVGNGNQKRDFIYIDDVISAIKSDKDIQGGEKKKIYQQAEEKILTPLSGDGDMNLGPTSTFYEELKAPFVAVGDAFMSIGDLGKDIMKIGKFFADGGLSGQTAALSRKYKNADSTGILRLDKQVFFEAAKKALTKAQLAEEAFPQAKYKHTAKQLQDSIKKWIEQNSIPQTPTSQ